MTIEEIGEIINDISYKDWRIAVITNESYWYIQVQFFADNEMQYGRKWLLSKFMTKSEIVTTALKAVLTAEEHEAREAFKYKGRKIFGPHFDVDVLVDIAGKKANLDLREPVLP